MSTVKKASSQSSKKKAVLASVEDFMIASEPSNEVGEMVALGHAPPQTGLGFRMQQQQQSYLPNADAGKPVALTSLVEACRHTIVLKLERYPPEVLASILEEEEWNLLLQYRHEKTRPKAGSGGLDGTGRIAPCLEHKFMTAVEACSPRFRASEVTDLLVWKDCVNYTFRKGGLTRPKNLEWPWPLMIKRIQKAGDNLLNEQLLNSDLPSVEQSLLLLQNSPMNVNLLLASGIGKTLKKAIKRHSKAGTRMAAPMDALLTKWKGLAEEEGVHVSSSPSSKHKVPKSESDKDWQKDWVLAERASNWRQLFAVLNERESNRRSQQGQRMREIRGNLNRNRPKVVKVRPASSKSRFTQASAPAATVPSKGNAKLAQLKREAQVTASRQNRGATSPAPRPSGGGFSMAVARAAGSKRRKHHPSSGGGFLLPKSSTAKKRNTGSKRSMLLSTSWDQMLKCCEVSQPRRRIPWLYTLLAVVFVSSQVWEIQQLAPPPVSTTKPLDRDNSSKSLFPFNTTESSFGATSPSSKCAINLYGLHRAFSSLVLPSLQKHVIPYNPHCDYFVHTYNLPQESGSRSGKGGSLEAPETVLEALREAVHKVYPDAVVELQSDTMSDFEQKRCEAINKVLTTFVTPEGTIVSASNQTGTPNNTTPLFFPHADPTYKFPHTILNILKMWHSQESVWKLMESKENQDLSNTLQYQSVGMLRSDVVYMTPISVRHHPPDTVVIPAFGRWPVSDRLIYGPRSGVEPWARHRFDHLDESIHVFRQNPKLEDHMMHSELFVQHIVFPQITVDRPFHIVEHPTNCFLRARADGTVWMSDCTTGFPAQTIYEELNKQYNPQLHSTYSPSSWASLNDWKYYFSWRGWQRKAHAVLAHRLENKILGRSCNALHVGEGRPKRVEMTC